MYINYPIEFIQALCITASGLFVSEKCINDSYIRMYISSPIELHHSWNCIMYRYLKLKAFFNSNSIHIKSLPPRPIEWETVAGHRGRVLKTGWAGKNVVTWLLTCCTDNPTGAARAAAQTCRAAAQTRRAAAQTCRAAAQTCRAAAQTCRAADMPGSSTDMPGRSTDMPGSSADTPGRSTDMPGRSTDMPGSSTDTPGSSADTPGSSTDMPGSSTDMPGSSTDMPGCSTDMPGSSTDMPQHRHAGQQHRHAGQQHRQAGWVRVSSHHSGEDGGGPVSLAGWHRIKPGGTAPLGATCHGHGGLT